MLRPASRPRRWRTLAGVLAALLAAPAVAVGSASAAQADPVRQQELWVLNAVNVAGVWQHTHGSGVTVALIDSGVNGQVSDLSGSVTTGRDFSGVNTPATDANWGVHGTWMASLIAGHGHAGGSNGIMGVAPGAKILSIRAVTDQGDPGYRHYQHESESRVQQHLADAISYATSHRVSVISMSLGYQGASRQVRAAISDALAQGIVVVASSGNSGSTSSGQHGNAPYSFPADYPGVLGVGAVGENGLPAGFSSDNLSVQVAAPGVRVPAQGRDGQYWLVSGTSPACALTAGVAALIKSVFPTLAPALVVQAITSSTRDKPQGGYDQEVGFGTVDATAALRMAGRLARDQDTGQRGAVAAAQFGGGTGAIPPVPVAPRGRRQFALDSLIALACLAVVLIVAFRLIVTRRPAAAGVPGGRSGPGPPGGLTGPYDSRAPAGWAGASPADPRASGGLTGPADPRAPGGWAGGAPPATGPPDPAVGGGAAWSDGGATGHSRSARYWAPGGYKPSAGYPSSTEYGSPNGVQAQADPGPPADPGAAGAEPWPAGSGQPTGYGALEGSQWPAEPGPSAGSGPAGAEAWPAGSGQPVGYGASEGYQRPPDPGPSAGSGPAGAEPWPAGSGQPTGYGALEGSQWPAEPGPSAGSGAAGGYQPWVGSGPQADSGESVGYGLPHELGPSVGDGQVAGYLPPSASAEPSVGHRPSSTVGPTVSDGPAVGNGLAAGYGLSASAALPGAPEAPGIPGAFEALPSSSLAAKTGPVAGFGEPAEPLDLGAQVADPPAADDDTWPSSGRW